MPSTNSFLADCRSRDVTLPDGRTLAYALAGDPDGVPVVVNHGTPGSRLFAALLSEAARDAGVRLVVPDRPGYGRSSPPPAGWTWMDWPADCAALLEAESVDRTASLGFSGGSPFALALAGDDRTVRVGLVSAVVPPFAGGLATLARVPVVFRVLFRLFGAVSQVGGPEMIVGQYTDRDVGDAVATAVAADFRESLRQGARAPARENRLFATRALDSTEPSAPVRAWHGTGDTNAPLDPVGAFVDDVDGTVVTRDTDHLGTLLDCRRDVLSWLVAGVE